MAGIAHIQLGNQLIGTISLDADRVTGEGGPHDARLVLPLTITMHPQPAEATLALVELTCVLHLTMPTSDSTRVSLPVTFNPFLDSHCQSYPAASSDSSIEIRFPLSSALIVQLEQHRHDAADNAFRAYLSLRAATAWLYQTGNVYPAAPTSIAEHPFASSAGMFSKLAFFHNTTVENLAFQIPSSTWINNTLPGLGINHLHLVELYLPASGGPLPDTIISFFDNARQEYDRGNYQECIAKCRYIRNAVEQHMGATKQQPVGDVFALARSPSPSTSASSNKATAGGRCLRTATGLTPQVTARAIPEYSMGGSG